MYWSSAPGSQEPRPRSISRHGFKLGPAVGEEVARPVMTGEAPLLAPFSPDRFESP
jgi:glycine/D-amino acid oxidase-like deaminating enzyme